jgi:MoaA/NifB/PqqE/SkfB family radical SAM enzyme/SAM-dependent methyltransferase
MKALIKVGDRCNQECVFCHRLGSPRIDVPCAEIEARIDRAAQLGHSMVVLSGGEATLRPELFEWAARVAGRGMDFGLVTNGARLDCAALERLASHRLRYVHLSLHGGSTEVHDGVVGAPAFERVLGALEQLSGRGLEVWANCVVTKANLDRLGEVVEVLRPFPDIGLKFSMVEPRGGAAADFEALVPRVSNAAARVREAIASAGAGRAVMHDGFPFCHLRGLEDRRGDLRAHGFWTMAEVEERDLHAVDDFNTVHPERCRPCELRGRCPGLFTGYYERFGDEELRPVFGRPRSNSFNYVYEGRVVPPCKGDTCPVKALGIAPWHRGRHLFVRNGDRLARFRADTRDFSDADLVDVKHRTGQVYFDASAKDAPDDFARQLVKLAKAASCGPCPEALRCTGLYEPVFENLFLRDDARVLEILRALEGDVLDVGCGEGPYGDALADRARAGRIRYTGVEPERDRAEQMRARWPWARVLVRRAEDVALGNARFDHVLALRSWNHLRDPAAAMVRLVAALRPGGTLTLVDNEAFGLARTRPHAARAERSAAGFEHYRNDGAAGAETLLAGTGLTSGLRLIERRDVGPGTSNQWLLRYEAAA